MRLWGRNPYRNDAGFSYANVTAADATGIAGQHGVRLFISFGPQETSPNQQTPHAIIARGLCHLFVDQLPDNALPELFDSLKSMFDFYNLAPYRTPALPAPRRSLPAKVAGRQQRSALSFTDE